MSVQAEPLSNALSGDRQTATRAKAKLYGHLLDERNVFVRIGVLGVCLFLWGGVVYVARGLITAFS